MECVRLVTRAGIECNDDDHLDMVATDFITIVIDQGLLEERFLHACGVSCFTELLARLTLDLSGNQLSALPESIGRLQALPNVDIRLDNGVEVRKGTCVTMGPSSSD